MHSAAVDQESLREVFQGELSLREEDFILSCHSEESSDEESPVPTTIMCPEAKLGCQVPPKSLRPIQITNAD